MATRLCCRDVLTGSRERRGPWGTGTVLLARARPPPRQPGGSQRRDPRGLAEPGPPWATWSTNAATNQHVPECPCSRSSSCRHRTPTLRGATANRTPEPPHPATGLQVRTLPCWWAVAPGEARRHLQPWSPALPAWRPSVGRQQRQKPEEPRRGLAPPRSLVRGGPWSPELGGPGAWRRWHGSSGSRTSPRARVCRAQARGVAHTQPCRTPHATEVPSHVSASEPRKLQPALASRGLAWRRTHLRTFSVRNGARRALCRGTSCAPHAHPAGTAHGGRGASEAPQPRAPCRCGRGKLGGQWWPDPTASGDRGLR